MSSTEDPWNVHRETIRRLYLVENKSLKEVCNLMDKSPYNLTASEWKFETKLRDEWGFTKNLKEADWPPIVYHVSNRKKNGKESEIFLHEVPVPQKRVRKAIRLNPDASRSLQIATSPRLPRGVTIRTPSGSPNISTRILEQCSPSNSLTVTSMLNHRVPPSEIDMNDILYPMADVFSHQPPAEHPTISGFNFGFGEVGALSNAQSQELLDSMDLEQDGQPPNDFDILTFLRSDFNTTPVPERNQTGVSSWGGCYSFLLHNIPWFRFQVMIALDPIAGQILNPESSLLSPHLLQENLALDDRRKVLSGLLKLNFAREEDEIVPEFTSLMQILVPERFYGDFSQKLQQLLNPSSKCSNVQIAELALCFISNNILTDDRTDRFLKWITKDKPKDFFKLLFQMRTPTIQAVSTKLLESTARVGNASILQFLIDTGIDRSVLAGVKGGRLLQLTLYNRKADVALILLQSGADVNPKLSCKKWSYSLPPLHFAVRNGNVDMTRRLLNAGAQLNRYAEHGTALSEAILRGTLECSRLLLEAGADVDTCRVEGASVLDWAYLHSKMALYRMLLSLVQESKTSLSLSGIFCAAKQGVRTLSKYLEGKKNFDNFSQREFLEIALYLAFIYSDHSGSIKALLDIGVDPNVKAIDEDKTRPLVLAAMANRIDLAALLLEAGADIDTPRVLAVAAEDKENFEFLIFLTEHGANIELFGANALSIAAESKNFAAIKLLLRSGADINGPDNYGYSPVQSAARTGDLKVVKYLVREGADVNAAHSQNEGYSVLHFAVAGGNFDIVSFLIQAGAHVSTQPHSSGGRTLLEACVDIWKGGFSPARSKIFKLLLNAGASISGPQLRRRFRNWNSVLTSLITPYLQKTSWFNLCWMLGLTSIN